MSRQRCAHRKLEKVQRDPYTRISITGSHFLSDCTSPNWMRSFLCFFFTHFSTKELLFCFFGDKLRKCSCWLNLSPLSFVLSLSLSIFLLFFSLIFIFVNNKTPILFLFLFLLLLILLVLLYLHAQLSHTCNNCLRRFHFLLTVTVNRTEEVHNLFLSLFSCVSWLRVFLSVALAASENFLGV